MATTYEAIATVTVGSGGASSIDFTSIPQTYTDLVVKASIRSNLAQSYGDWISVRFNGNSSSTYTTKRLRTNPTSSTVTSDGDTNYTQLVQGQAASANATASTFGNTEFYIPNYAGSSNKSVSSDFTPENNDSNIIRGIAAGIWANTSAITQVTLIPQDGTSFNQYSTATLYGIKNS